MNFKKLTKKMRFKGDLEFEFGHQNRVLTIRGALNWGLTVLWCEKTNFEISCFYLEDGGSQYRAIFAQVMEGLVINRAKIPLLIGKFLKKLEYLGPDQRCAERMRRNKRRHRP